MNSAKEIDKKYLEKEQARRRNRRGLTVAASNNFVLSSMVPTVEQYLDVDVPLDKPGITDGIV